MPTDKERLNAVIRWAKDACSDPHCEKKMFAEDIKNRRIIDAAIRASKSRRGKRAD